MTDFVLECCHCHTPVPHPEPTWHIAALAERGWSNQFCSLRCCGEYAYELAAALMPRWAWWKQVTRK